MEDDIKILENKIKRSRELNEEVGVHIFFNEDLINIVEKLIKAYKEKEDNTDMLKMELEKKDKIIKFLKEHIDEITKTDYSF